MESVSIEFTTRCNLRCVYCGVTQPGYKAQDLALENFDELIQDLKKRRTNWILVNGHGETTIAPDWHIYCQKLINAGFRLKIITNLSKKLSDEEIAILSQFNRIEISCDTVDSELHSFLRKGSKLEVIYQNMERILKEGSPYISWSCVVSNKNVYFLPEYVREATNRGVREFSFCNLVEYGGPVEHVSKVDDPQKALSAIKDARNLLDRNKIPYAFMEAITDSLKGSHGQKGHKYFTSLEPGQTRDCIEPWVFSQIAVNGEVRPCCHHRAIGTLTENSLHEILDGTKLKALKEGLLSGDLDQDCLECRAKGTILTSELKKKIPSPAFQLLKNIGFKFLRLLKKPEEKR